MWLFAVAAAFSPVRVLPRSSAPASLPLVFPVETRYSSGSPLGRDADVQVPFWGNVAQSESGEAWAALPCAVLALSAAAAGATRAAHGPRLTRRRAVQTAAGASLAASFGLRPAAAAGAQSDWLP